MAALVGPPELAPIASPILPSGDSLVDLMVANYNTVAKRKEPLKGTTVNGSATYTTTGNPCLDFFFHVVPDTPPETLKNFLKKAWDKDPLKALKLVCNLRGIRGTGKSDREGFYTAALWLHSNHPKTLATNAAAFVEFGYLKDLLEITSRILERPTHPAERDGYDSDDYTSNYGGYQSDYGRPVSSSSLQRKKVSKEESSIKHEEERIKKAKKVVEKFHSDPNFKLLHECVSDLFAQKLRSDMKLLNSGESSRISSAAKWCPSLDSSYDKTTLLCETIAKKVFPLNEYPEDEGVEEAHYAYRVRDRLRKQVLVPLRKALQLPEVCLHSNEWGSIPYERVASDAMKIYKEKFLKYDKERFEEYLARVNSGEAKINSSALLPLAIIRGVKDPVSELQWKSMVAEMAKKGNLGNCLAVCDVSKSMNGVPMEAAMALGILVSELGEGPWKGKLITFSNYPKLEMVEGDSLRAKSQFVKRVDSEKKGKNLQQVFDVLLRVAVQGKLKAEEMVKRVFVFSDMEFGGDPQQHRGYSIDSRGRTDYMAIKKMFKQNGYGDCVPEMVFWNLRNSETKDNGYHHRPEQFHQATPVPADQPGVALVSGYSKNPLSLFLDKGGIAAMDPESVMEAAISGEAYHQLVIVD